MVDAATVNNAGTFGGLEYRWLSRKPDKMTRGGVLVRGEDKFGARQFSYVCISLSCIGVASSSTNATQQPRMNKIS